MSINMVNEQWRRVPECPAYEVSSLGRVRRGDRLVRLAVNRQSHRAYVRMCQRGEVVTRTVHSVVLAAFVGPRPSDAYGAPLVINHRDMNPSNNRLENLEYTSQARNSWHARGIKNGRIPNGTSAHDAPPCAGHWPQKKEIR